MTQIRTGSDAVEYDVRIYDLALGLVEPWRRIIVRIDEARRTRWPRASIGSMRRRAELGVVSQAVPAHELTALFEKMPRLGRLAASSLQRPSYVNCSKFDARTDQGLY